MGALFGKRRRRLDLAAAVGRLPRQAREAMLAGLSGETIIAGAYTDSRGGVCPMLAAHRRGVRTSGSEFARAWDLFTGARRPAPARPDDLRTLAELLEASLARETKPAVWMRPVRRYDDLCAALEDLGLDDGLTLDPIGGRRETRALAMTQEGLR